MTSSKHQTQQTALIVGASRGLGFALADEYLKRGWQVIATVRHEKPGPLHELAASADGRLEIELLDINSPAQLQALSQRLAGRDLDLLFVNAGVAIDAEKPIAEISTDAFVDTMVTNALSPMRVIETLAPLVAVSGSIVAMSSDLGSVGNNIDGGWEAYRASKAALNTLMRSFAARHAGDPRSLLLIAPGWVRTDMGGPEAVLSVEESIPCVVDVIATHAGHHGLKFLNYLGMSVPW
ncbi:SDR family NAD(P)-dependent oxidoreductase [Dyella terrae]|uniref:SDR family NAD(P)-dependent oxidoreductase n=1 Tax=Dyella terrae TaxID=522259 RepID=UPI001EFD34EE|nr:SDR family NAD(P)-dependent oxidoreductase [Dyella terrae]ULU23556.1 SDR family NAD(P)-dependent oxidoreductase [Dyella terrae]